MSAQHRKRAYSFGLHTRNLGHTRQVRSPLTGSIHDFPIDDGISASERDAVLRILTSKGFKAPVADEGYVLSFSEDQLRFRGIESPGSITAFAAEIVAERVSTEMLEILLAIARDGNLAFTSFVGDNACVLDRIDDQKTISRWPDARLIRTANDLLDWLIDDIGGRYVI